MPMNYIDPMTIYRSKPDTGAMISSAVNTIGQTVGNIFAQLPEAQRRDVETMDDQTYKTGLLSTAKEALQKIGIDPNTIQFPNPQDQRLDKAAFTEQIGNLLAPYAEGQGATLTPELFNSLGQSQNPNVQENLQRQSFLTKYDPIGRIDISKMQTVQPSQTQPEGQLFGPALPEGSQSSYDPITGTGVDAMTGQTNVAPQSKAFDVDSTLGMMTPLLVEAVKNKEISPEKATEKILDLKMADQKEKSEERKFWREMFKSGLASRDAVNPETGETETITEDNWTKLGLGKKQASGGTGVFGYRLRYATPENIAKAKEVVQALRSTGKYSEDYLLALDHEADVDPLLVLQTVTGKRAGTEENIRGKVESIPINADNAESVTAAQTRTKRDIQKEEPVLSEGSTGALGDAALGVKYLNQLKSALLSGDVNYFDMTKAGQFTNPEVDNAYIQLNEIVGRNRSGAAISASEWKSFAKQILNKNYLLTEEGRRAALESLEDYIDRFYGSGMTLTGDENWLTNYQDRIRSARNKTESKPASTSAPSAQGGNSPAIGTVEDGYVYVGGDPASPDSWVESKK